MSAVASIGGEFEHSNSTVKGDGKALRVERYARPARFEICVHQEYHKLNVTRLQLEYAVYPNAANDCWGGGDLG